MKQTITDKREEAYTDRDGFIVLPGFFPRLAYMRSVNKALSQRV